MKRLLFIFLLGLLYINGNAQEQETLSNQSVIDMKELGFSDDVIITKINSSDCLFDTSINSLKILKEKGISNEIIIAIMEVNKKDKENKQEQDNAISGIFYKEDGKLKKIYPTTFSGTKMNTLGTAFSYGIASTKIRSTMPRSTSQNIVKSTQPEFYFLFNSSNIDASLSNWWFSVASSPNQFVLVKLTPKRNSRELETGKVNIYAGTEMGVSEDASIKFKSSAINDSEFKVTPESVLEPGEYCFFYQGSIPMGGYTNQAVFDFSIPSNAYSPAKYRVGNVVWVNIDNKIKQCTITEVHIRNNNVLYKGETNYSFKTIAWKEPDCSFDKEELKANKFQIDGIDCQVVKKYGNGMVICTSKELTPDQIRQVKNTQNLSGRIMFNLEDNYEKGDAYAGIDEGFIILYKNNEFIKL